jgi:hypothetical protein
MGAAGRAVWAEASPGASMGQGPAGRTAGRQGQASGRVKLPSMVLRGGQVKQDQGPLQLAAQQLEQGAFSPQ